MMTTTGEDLTRAALGLPVEERAALAERLLASLDELSEAESDRLWAQEAERRLAAHRNGTAGSRSAEEVYARAEKVERLICEIAVGVEDTDARRCVDRGSKYKKRLRGENGSFGPAEVVRQDLQVPLEA